MPATTATGWPYPLGTDRVMDGDDAIKNLATMADARLGRGITAGQASVPITAANTNATVAVTFPAGMFVNPPHVSLAIYHTNTSQFFPPTIVTGTLTATGMTISGCRSSGTAAFPVEWIALALT